MLVKFNEARVLMVPLDDGAPMLRIMPQVNEIPDDVWSKIRPSLTDKLAVAKGARTAQLEELFSAPAKTGAKGVTGKTFQDLGAAEASALVLQTLDVALLKTWKQLEKRDDVRRDISNQIEELAKRNKSGKKDEA